MLRKRFLNKYTNTALVALVILAANASRAEQEANVKKDMTITVKNHAQDASETVVRVPDLLTELASTEIDRIQAATESLVEAGSSVVPALAEELTTTADPFVRLKIVEVFARLRGAGSDALPVLSSRVIQDKGALREHAARAINWITTERKDRVEYPVVPDVDAVVAALVADLDHKDPKVKDSAARSVAYLAPILDAAARDALIPDLLALTENQTTTRHPGAYHFVPGITRYPVREAAAWTLEQFGTDDPRVHDCLSRYHGRRLFARLDLTLPELAEVAAAVEADEYSKALQLYKPIFLQRIGAAAFEEPWNWGYIGSADQLLTHHHTAKQYALKTGATRYVGAPGAMDWFIDERQNNSWPELTHRMSWTGYLLKPEHGGFAKDGNPAYLRHWMDVFSDFDSNLRHQQAIAEEQYRGIGIGNVWWGYDGSFGWILWQAFRAEARMNGLAYAVRTFPGRTQEAVDEILLAKFLVAAAEDIDYMVPWLTNVNVIAETSCPSNQLQHAVTAVIKGCVAFYDFKSKSHWEDAITTYVTKLLPYYPDGTELEQAFWYNGGVISFAQKFLELYPQNENAERLRRLALYAQRFLACISLPHNGNTPGEAKTHKKVALSPYFRDPLTERIVNKVAAGEEEATPSVQPPGSTATVSASREEDASNGRTVPAFDSIAFPYSGYYILRDGWHHNALHAYFKGGRKGTGHSAATSNQIQLTAYGRTMLTRAGSGLYGPGPWPTYSPYVNSSFGHNTIVVDGKSQNDPDAPQQPDPIPARWLASESFDFAESKYDSGYEDLDADISHERQMVFFREAGLLIVRDRLDAQNEHEYSQIWCFGKEYEEDQVLADEQDQRVVTRDGSGPNVAIYHSGPTVRYTRYYGQKEPDSRGWRDKDYPAVDIHASWKGTGAQQLLTVLYPRSGEAFDIERLERTDSEGVAGVSIRRTDGSKIEGRSALDGGQSLEIGGLRIFGEALFLYTAADGTVSGLALGASEASFDGKELNLAAADFAFEVSDGRLEMTAEIRVPTGFEWKETPAGIVPQHRAIQTEEDKESAPTLLIPDGTAVAAGQHALIAGQGTRSSAAISNPSVANHWFASAGLGLFIHYGIASAANVELSWAMIRDAHFNPNNNGVMTPNDYYALAPKMTAADYHPERWLKAAKDAGFTYAVLTAKHHDGYTLWPSASGDMGVQTFLPGRDLVKDFVTACRSVGLKVGLYYSPPDWYFERHARSWRYTSDGSADAPYLDMDHQSVASLPPLDSKARADYVNGQLRELLSGYGPIDYLWFDGAIPGVMDQENIGHLQPGILMNERQHGAGDVITYPYEVKVPTSRPGGLWEHCFPLQPNWGYAENAPVAPISTLTDRLARCRSWGGSVLANFGPRPDGEMPGEYYLFMKDMAEWMSWAAPAVTDVLPAVEPERCSLPTTVRSSIWYAFLPLPEENSVPKPLTVTLTCEEAPKSVRRLRDGLELAVTFADDTATFRVEPDPLMQATEVLEIRW